MRPDKDNYFMTIAWAVSRRATCVRKSQGVGCVLVNGLGHIVGTGYNGRPRGFLHCNEMTYTGNVMEAPQDFSKLFGHACPGAFDPPGAKPETCEAVHAEVNAVLQCYDSLWIRSAYVTRSPCAATCIKTLLNTACTRIVFAEKSSDADRAGEIWARNNSSLGGHGELREWIHLPTTNPFGDNNG